MATAASDPRGCRQATEADDGSGSHHRVNQHPADHWILDLIAPARAAIPDEMRQIVNRMATAPS